jgi:hypothetical protein
MCVTAAAVMAAAFTAAAAAPSALATTIEVSTEHDALTKDGQCSLREAVSNANTCQVLFAGEGQCPPGTGDDTIRLPAGHFVLSRGGRSEDLNG